MTLFDQINNKTKLIGVVSWGEGESAFSNHDMKDILNVILIIRVIITGCGRPGYPGVYGKVTKVLDWIHEYVGLPGKVK